LAREPVPDSLRVALDMFKAPPTFPLVISESFVEHGHESGRSLVRPLEIAGVALGNEDLHLRACGSLVVCLGIHTETRAVAIPDRVVGPPSEPKVPLTLSRCHNASSFL